MKHWTKIWVFRSFFLFPGDPCSFPLGPLNFWHIYIHHLEDNVNNSRFPSQFSIFLAVEISRREICLGKQKKVKKYEYEFGLPRAFFLRLRSQNCLGNLITTQTIKNKHNVHINQQFWKSSKFECFDHSFYFLVISALFRLGH